MPKTMRALSKVRLDSLKKNLSSVFQNTKICQPRGEDDSMEDYSEEASELLRQLSQTTTTASFNSSCFYEGVSFKQVPLYHSYMGYGCTCPSGSTGLKCCSRAEEWLSLVFCNGEPFDPTQPDFVRLNEFFLTEISEERSCINSSQILKDLHRTFPTVPYFDRGAPGYLGL